MDMTTNAINKIQEMALEAAGKKIIKNIQDYLTKGLQDLIQTKHITIIA